MRIVQCHGCFDLLHVGHIRHLEAAKALGDKLIVTVTSDQFVNKGPGRPVFPLEQRMEAIRALRCVDEVRSSDAPTAVDAIRAIRPNVFAKGPDYTVASMDLGEVNSLFILGADIVFTQTEKWSSTALLHRQSHRPEIEAYLSTLRHKYSVADVRGWLEQARALKVLVIGETIHDVYRYQNALGKSGKEPILATKFTHEEHFDGGVLAVAGHVGACSDAVTVLTGPPIVKRRFIETYPFQKLYEEYEMDEAAQAAAGNDWHRDIEAHLVVAADYGHGLLTPHVLNTVTAHAEQLAVNVQANAGNHGFNTISKYRRADFISLSERELRLDARDQTTDVRTLMQRAANPRKATLLITRGEKGCLAYGADNGFHDGFAEAPALASHTVDRMGAGDAVFGVTACCAAVGMPLDLLAFVAAVVGTMAVGIVGNARYIEREALLTAIESYLA